MTNLKAGPELDALVAEKVMGLALDPDDSIGKAITKTMKKIGGDFAFNEVKTIQVIPPYSTSIDAAWGVLRKFKCPWIWRDDVIGLEWKCELDNGDADLWGRGETAPLAICRAALKAVGHE